MGYIHVQDVDTGETLLEVGVKPVWMHADEYVCPNSGIGMSPKPKQQYVERMKDTKDDQ